MLSTLNNTASRSTCALMNTGLYNTTSCGLLMSITFFSYYTLPVPVLYPLEIELLSQLFDIWISENRNPSRRRKSMLQIQAIYLQLISFSRFLTWWGGGVGKTKQNNQHSPTTPHASQTDPAETPWEKHTTRNPCRTKATKTRPQLALHPR